jgi:hypothetical protein
MSARHPAHRGRLCGAQEPSRRHLRGFGAERAWLRAGPRCGRRRGALRVPGAAGAAPDEIILADTIGVGVYLLRGMGYELSTDLQALIACAAWLSDQLGKDLPGQVYRADAFAPVAQ